jgi:hypothetical protein
MGAQAGEIELEGAICGRLGVAHEDGSRDLGRALDYQVRLRMRPRPREQSRAALPGRAAALVLFAAK